MRGNLIIVVGPTAVGKTDFCVQLAKTFDSEIISCDSRQLYKEMAIGTAKPTPLEMQGVKHHFIDSHSVDVLYSAGDFERDVEKILIPYFESHKVAIMAGGTGLFVRAITHGLDEMPAAPEEIRTQLMQRLETQGLEVLQEELRNLDPEAYAEMDIQNSQRVVRALEVCLFTGKPFSGYKLKEAKTKPYNIIKIGLERDREELYARINQRVDKMLADGLLEEVERLKAFRNKNALQTVGYKEVFGYLDGEYDYNTMVELLKRNTRRYAKRQLTWFKNQDTFTWFHPTEYNQAVEYIKKNLV